MSADDSARLCDVHDRISVVMESLRSVASIDVSVRFLPGASPRTSLPDDDGVDASTSGAVPAGRGGAEQGRAYGPVWRVVRVQGVLWRSGFVSRILCPLLRQYWRYMRPRVVSLVRDAVPTVASSGGEPEGGGGAAVTTRRMVEVRV